MLSFRGNSVLVKQNFLFDSSEGTANYCHFCFFSDLHVPELCRKCVVPWLLTHRVPGGRRSDTESQEGLILFLLVLVFCSVCNSAFTQVCFALICFGRLPVPALQENFQPLLGLLRESVQLNLAPPGHFLLLR